MAYKEVKWPTIFENDSGGWVFAVVKTELDVEQPMYSSYDFFEPDFISPVYPTKEEAVLRFMEWIAVEYNLDTSENECSESENGEPTQE